MSLVLYSNVHLLDFQRTHFYFTYVEDFHLLASFFRMPLMDRTGVLKTGLKAINKHPIPTPGKVGSFQDICDDRATSILNEAEETGKRIDVHWSGGIDSTVALVSFLRNALPDDLGRIRIVMTKGSIDEYPEFYDKWVKGKLNVFFMEDDPNYKGRQYYIDEEAITVTGEHGDQIFGSDNYLVFSDPKPLLMHPTLPSFYKMYSRLATGDLTGIRSIDYDECLEVMVQMALGSKCVNCARAHTEKLLTYVEPLLNAAPFEIVSLADFLWWINFSQKWHYVYYRTTHTNCTPIGVNTDGFRNFFGTDSFQKWAMDESNHRTLKVSGNRVADYKMTAKDYIYLFTKDDAYRQNKIKVGSLRLAVPKQLAEITDLNYFFTDDHVLRSFDRRLPENESAYESIFGE